MPVDTTKILIDYDDEKDVIKECMGDFNKEVMYIRYMAVNSGIGFTANLTANVTRKMLNTWGKKAYMI